MKTGLFTVFDNAANRFLEPFPAETVEVAIRSFREIVNTDGHQFNKFPQDYTLFHVGVFDQELGTIDAFDTPRSLGLAITFLPTNPEGETPMIVEQVKEVRHHA